jgi:serine protease SohB
LVFLTEYGLFLAKSITVLAVILIIIVAIAANAMRNHSSNEEDIEVRKMNDEFDDIEAGVKEILLDQDALKSEKKALKQKDKADKKALKKKKKEGDEADEGPKKRMFVTSFDGDVKASEAETLSRVISAVLMVATPKDEFVLKLESPGGMVHSYGFAASQLARIRDKGIPLTICVDKVAASGGYMMACIADKILAAPFAVIGSIGVVAQLPNFHKVLKKNDIDYETFTAGEYKRTVTMFGENTEQGRSKFKEELEDTHVLFKEFITRFRPSVDIEKVATGEVWYGVRAIEEKLIDGLKSSDDYIFDARKDCDIFSVNVVSKKTLMEKLGVSVETGIESAFHRILRQLNQKFFV